MSTNAKELLNQLQSPEDLRRLLDVPGVDKDSLIEQFVSKVGPGVALDQLFSIMTTRFRPGIMRTGVIQWEITAPDGLHIYQMHLTASGATVTKGESLNARATLSVNVPTLLRLCAHRLNPVKAFWSWKLRIQGNFLVAASLPLWFDY